MCLADSTRCCTRQMDKVLIIAADAHFVPATLRSNTPQAAHQDRQIGVGWTHEKSIREEGKEQSREADGTGTLPRQADTRQSPLPTEHGSLPQASRSRGGCRVKGAPVRMIEDRQPRAPHPQHVDNGEGDPTSTQDWPHLGLPLELAVPGRNSTVLRASPNARLRWVGREPQSQSQRQRGRPAAWIVQSPSNCSGQPEYCRLSAGSPEAACRTAPSRARVRVP